MIIRITIITKIIKTKSWTLISQIQRGKNNYNNYNDFYEQWDVTNVHDQILLYWEK